MAGKVRNKRNFYIVRLRKDDSIVAVGTAEECTKALGFESVSIFYCMVSRVRSGSDRNKKYDVDIVPEEDEEDA
jgi:hypothetical protein